MQFSVVTLFMVGLACVTAAPVDEQQKVVQDIKQAFEPVATQVRSLMENGEKAMETVGIEASKAGERLMDNAKNLFNTMQHTDRANLPSNVMERAAGIREEFNQDLRSLLEKAAESAEPMKGNLRSILYSARDAMESLEKRYLTEDGRDLLRSVASMAGAQIHLPEPVAAQ